jgi:acyl-CoA thioesterase FadM
MCVLVAVWSHVALPFGHGCPSLQLNVAYKRFVRLLQEVKLVAVIERIDGRKVYMRGRIECPATGKVLASAEAVFYCMTEPAKMLTYEQGRELLGANSRYSTDELLALFSRKSKL